MYDREGFSIVQFQYCRRDQNILFIWKDAISTFILFSTAFNNNYKKTIFLFVLNFRIIEMRIDRPPYF